MGIKYIKSSSQSHFGNASINTLNPFSIAFWFYKSAAVGSDTGHLVSYGRNGSNHYVSFNSTSLSSIGFSLYDGITFASINPAPHPVAILADTWNHIAGVVASPTDFYVYLNGGNKGTYSGTAIYPIMNRLSLGARNFSTLDNFGSGTVSCLTTWNIALSDDEIASLAAGMYPLLIKRSNIVNFYPLNGDGPGLTCRNRISLAAGNNDLLPNNGPTKDISPMILRIPPATY